MGDPSLRLSFPGNTSVMHSCYDKHLSVTSMAPWACLEPQSWKTLPEAKWFLYLMQETLDRRLKRREEVGRRQANVLSDYLTSVSIRVLHDCYYYGPHCFKQVAYQMITTLFGELGLQKVK